MIEELINLRRELHQYPELSGQEKATALRIKDFINTHGNTEVIENLGGHGLAFVYRFSEEGPTVMIRCELDALPIEELNKFDHRSLANGVSHKCGHDGHMTMVAGLIFKLRDQHNLRGKVILLFQPAEETGKGAHKMMADSRFVELDPDYVFALHNIPGEPLNTIITTGNQFSATVQSFSIKINGKECHAAQPDKGTNPAYTISHIIAKLNALNVYNESDADFAVLTPVYINLGDQNYGISPGEGELHYTIRTWSTTTMDQLKQDIENTIEQVCTNQGVTTDVSWFEYFPTTKNNPACNVIIKKTANQNGFTLKERAFPYKFGEDFGWFSQKYKAAMFGLGSGIKTPALHHADYDFPDEIIDTGVDMFYSIIENILPGKTLDSLDWDRGKHKY